jgi:hypothetical protein
MIAKTYIAENLRRLDVRHTRTSDPSLGFYFAKLAVLELCGWIEMSMDDMIMRHCGRHIKLTSNYKFVENDVVKRTYGFDYDRHFRLMLIKLVGVVQTERIESGMNVGVQTRFKAELQSLKAIRDLLAHTYAKNPPPIDAPSRTRARFQPVYDGLIAYDSALRAL